MFGRSSFEPLPEDINTSHKAWDNYMSDLWSKLIQLLLSQLNNVKSDPNSIIEIAPGHSLKIPLALKTSTEIIGMTIIEADPFLASKVRKRYSELLPKTNIHVISKSIQTLNKDDWSKVPKNAIIVANHPLDDMLINLLADSKRNSPSELFNWTQKDGAGISNITLNMLEEFKNRSEAQQNKLVTQLLQHWQFIIENSQAAGLIISQYPSYTLAHSPASDLNDIGIQILKKLKKQLHSHLIPQSAIQNTLNTCLNYNHPHIGHNILDAENWLLYCKSEITEKGSFK